MSYCVIHVGNILYCEYFKVACYCCLNVRNIVNNFDTFYLIKKHYTITLIIWCFPIGGRVNALHQYVVVALGRTSCWNNKRTNERTNQSINKMKYKRTARIQFFNFPYLKSVELNKVNFYPLSLFIIHI